jgi:hypothetical protein
VIDPITIVLPGNVMKLWRQIRRYGE